MKITITGANGFIGSALMRSLSVDHEVVGIVRSVPGLEFSYHLVPDIRQITAKDLIDVECVIHTAGVTNARAKPSVLNEANVGGAEKVAQACLQAKVPRLINISSLKAFGEGSVNWLQNDHPATPYGESKRQAELAISDILNGSATEVTQLRLPLVYSPLANNNFKRLEKLALSGWPLPFASLRAKRSYCWIGNLVELIRYLLSADQLDQQILYCADLEAVSLPEMMSGIADASSVDLRMMPCPEPLFSMVTKLLSKNLHQQLFCDAIVGVSETQNAVPGWKPKTTQEALDEMYKGIGRDGRI